MRSRDRRALAILVLWSAGTGLYVGGRTWWNHHRARVELRARVTGLQHKEAFLRGACADAEVRRGDGMKAYSPEMKAMPEDQLRLKGQDSLLGAAGQAGLHGLRLRPQGVESHDGLLNMKWTLECEGTLAQWLAGLGDLERAQPLMAVVGFHLNLPGDPWVPATTEAEGPSLKGSIELLWTIPRG